jgi:hypothetical protein
VDNLRVSYDGGAELRDRQDKQPWKVAERTAFLRRLQQAGCARLLEIGAGTGQGPLMPTSPRPLADGTLQAASPGRPPQQPRVAWLSTLLKIMCVTLISHVQGC